MTAFGVYTGLKAAVRHRLGKNDLKGVKVAVQGLGNVGYNLCRHLSQDGAKLFVTDVQTDRIDMAAREFGAQGVALNDIYGVDADVFAPCALGAILNDATLKQLKAKVVAGAANNQLAEARHGRALKDMSILYAPDYVINAGGLISVYYEYAGRTASKPYDRQRVVEQVEKIYATTESIFKKAEQDNISTSEAADAIAEQRFKGKPSSIAA